MLKNNSNKLKKLAHVIAAIGYMFLFRELWDIYLEGLLTGWHCSKSTISTVFSLGLLIPGFSIAAYAISPPVDSDTSNSEDGYIKIWQGRESLAAMLFSLFVFTAVNIMMILTANSLLNKIVQRHSILQLLLYIFGVSLFASIQVFLTIGIYRRLKRNVDHAAWRVISLIGVILSYFLILLIFLIS